MIVYTRYLKRTTPQNIVIGGAAGAIPAVVGWAAATGNLALPALFLFLIVFYWTPPHFWALALLIQRDYAAAKVPMLPVVRGESAPRPRSSATRSFSSPSLFFRSRSAISAGSTSAPRSRSGQRSWRWQLQLYRETTPARAKTLFTFSLSYLALLFVAMAIDPLVVFS